AARSAAALGGCGRAGAVSQDVPASRGPGQAVAARPRDAEDGDPMVEGRQHDLQAPVLVEIADRGGGWDADPVPVLPLVRQADVVEPLAGGGENDESAGAGRQGVRAEDELRR